LQINGFEVLINDDHQAKKMRIADCCIVNPHIADDARCKVLCTVGLVFKVSHVLLKVFRRRNDRRALTYSIKNDLDLVALGTIADMSQLIYDNRIFCKFGLKILSGKCRRPGIEALCKSADIPSGTNLCQADVSFKLCPRLNACGRLADAVLPISMMMSNDFDEATTYAYELDETNKERQLIEKEIMEQADRLARKNYMEDSALVLYDKTWHSGVVGIVSSKLAKDYARPCIVLGSERNMARGSGRSTNNVNLIDAMCECSEYLETWGGHPYAVGVSMPAANVDAFRRAFNEVIARQSAGTSKRCEMEYSLELLLEEINGGLTKELEMLQPFGQKNQEPVFLLKNVKINDLPETFGSQKSHIKFWLIDKYSKRMLVIGWNCAANIPPIGIPLDLLITANYETWNRIRSTRLTMIDWAISRTE
jgi:single-stranded-DNA-specific exonuclease